MNDLKDIARRAMLEHGLQPDFSLAVLEELMRIDAATDADHARIRDLRELLWCSIDDHDSRDLALHCNEQERNASKVERQVRKAASAALLSQRIGERFTGVVTGASPKGTWVRIERPIVEGKVVRKFRWPRRRRSRRCRAHLRCGVNDELGLLCKRSTRLGHLEQDRWSRRRMQSDLLSDPD